MNIGIRWCWNTKHQTPVRPKLSILQILCRGYKNDRGNFHPESKQTLPWFDIILSSTTTADYCSLGNFAWAGPVFQTPAEVRTYSTWINSIVLHSILSWKHFTKYFQLSYKFICLHKFVALLLFSIYPLEFCKSIPLKHYYLSAIQ